MRTRSMGYMNFFYATPTPVGYKVVATVFCNATADLATVQANVNAALVALTTPGFGFIGRTIYYSEVIETIYKADPNVLYVKLSSPSTDFATYFNITNLESVQAGVGSAPASTDVTYYLSGVNTFTGTAQESLPVQVSISTTSQTGNGIQLTWDEMGGLSAINVYTQRPGGTLGLLATLPGNASSFFDDFSLTPTSQQPVTIDQFGVFYPNCTNIQVTMQVATDRGAGFQG